MRHATRARFAYWESVRYRRQLANLRWHVLVRTSLVILARSTST